MKEIKLTLKFKDANAAQRMIALYELLTLDLESAPDLEGEEMLGSAVEIILDNIAWFITSEHGNCVWGKDTRQKWVNRLNIQNLVDDWGGFKGIFANVNDEEMK